MEEPMRLLCSYICEIVASDYKPVGMHEMSIFYGTDVENIPAATLEEQDEFHAILDQDEGLRFAYLNKWLVGRGLQSLDIVD